MTTTTTTYPPLTPDTYSVRVEFAAPTSVIANGRSNYKMIATVVDTLNVEPEIFVHQRKPTNNMAEPYMDEFMFVAGPSDMSAVPNDIPSATGFIRKSSVNILLPNYLLYDELVTSIKERVQLLCDSLSAADIVAVQSVFVGEAPKP